MAFRPTILFAVANQGTTPRILAVQGPQTIDANVASVGGFALIGTVSLTDGAGNVLAGDYSPAFTITWDGAGTDTGTIAFNRAGFDTLGGAPTTLRDRLIQAFATGGRLVLQVDASQPAPNNPLNLPILLAALRTSDYVVNPGGTTATPAHHPHAVAPTANLAAPPPTGGAGDGYTFQCTALSASNLVVNAAGVFDVTAASPPNNTFNRNLTISTQLQALNGAGVSVTFNATSVLPIDLHLHTQVVLTLDRSGSMGTTSPTGNSKWDEAVAAASLFSTLYGDAVPARSTPNGTVLDNANLRYGRWRFQAAFDVEYQPAAANPAALASAKLQHTGGLLPGGGTPIGEALVHARGRFTDNQWRRRHLILLSDGMSNSGAPTIAQVMGDYATHLPRLSDNASTGVIAHVVTYALTTEAPVFQMDDLANDHGGIYIGTEAAGPKALDPELLRDGFLNMLARILPIELETNIAGDNTFLIEDGVERVIFVGKAGAGLTAAGPGGDVQNASGVVASLGWASVDDPRPGTWTVSGANASESIYAVLDVSLRMAIEVEPQGLGQPIKLRASLDFRGIPVTGADVRVGLRRPGESVGEVITSFVRRKGLGRAVHAQGRPQLLHADLGAMLVAKTPFDAKAQVVTAATAAAGVSTPSGDTKSLQRLLLEAAERARNLEFQYAGSSIPLVEVSPGVYEGSVPAGLTQEEGVYDLAFRADGFTPAGYAFGRNLRRSVTLAPIPNGANSETSVTQAAAGNNVLWTATVFPRTVTGRPLGPGLGYALAFHYAREADRTKLPPPVTIDNLDGTYSTHVELPRGEKLAPLALVFGPPKADLSNGVLVEEQRRVKRVKVTLQKLQVLDDKDACLAGAGELVFDTLVAPNGNPARAVRTRFPVDGVLKAKSGEAISVEKIIYEGLVENDAGLAVTIGGRELDWLLFFRREEQLARYHRDIPLRDGSHVFSPDNEPSDPESLRDWKVWYRVDVN